MLRLAILACVLLPTGIRAQDNPDLQGSESLAKPRQKAGGDAGDRDESKIPSKLAPHSGKDDAGADGTFTAEASVVTVDVAVLDNQGNPIPRIPKSNFRILEDNVPQTIAAYSTAEAPLTVALVVEFSNQPMRAIDARGKPFKYTIVAKAGYTAPRPVE